MSYQLKVLQDYPIAYYPLTEIYNKLSRTYQEVLDNYATYQDLLNHYPTYLSILETVVHDVSGCNNHGLYVGEINYSDIFPLVAGGLLGTKITNNLYLTLPITKDYYGATAKGGFAIKGSSDNSFSIELWLYPKIVTTSTITLFADAIENIGIFYEKGNIVFNLGSERLDYTLPNISQSHHIVATYSITEMSLYVNGKFAASKSLINYKFTNESIELTVGPTLSSSDYFIIDAPAVYRYALGSDKILEHFSYSGTTSPLQVSYPQSGTLFEIYDDSVSKQFNFAYPANKPLEIFASDDLIYNTQEKCLEINKTTSVASKSVVVVDAIAIPAGFDLDSSKIEWNGDNGISVRTSTDGTTWQACINGRAIPQFKLGSFSSKRTLYLEITFASSDTSKFIPRLYSLLMCFYKDQVLYSISNPDYIYTIEGSSGFDSKDITLGRVKYPILSRQKLNGLTTAGGSGFKINTAEAIRTVELFLTLSDLTSNSILSSSANGNFVSARYSWENNGTITKSNISAIYVNGVNRTSNTNINSIFTANEIYHVMIVTSGPITGQILFNHLTTGGPSSLYQYISYYPEAFSAPMALSNYNMHIGRSATIADDSSMTLTENSVEFYDNDWIVLQNQ
jgi:hypothetical protein